MSDVSKAIATQLKNIETKTGKSLTQLAELVKSSGLSKHGEVRDWLKTQLGLGHGDANTLVHHVFQTDGETAAREQGLTDEDVLAGIYVGPKASLRPIHDRLMAEIMPFGTFEVAPKKGYVSLRRKKQFAMIGPATNTRMEVGLNMKGVAGTERLIEQPAGGMCNYKVKLTTPDEVDAELISWIKQAFDASN